MESKAMAEWQDGSIESNGIRLHYMRTGGDKAPFVLAHGLTDNLQAWTRFARVFAATYDLIMVDARGHGLSDKPEHGYSPRELAQDLAGVIQGLGLNKPIVMGHSMGAVTASWVSAEYPELISATILEDPVWSWPKPSEQSAVEKQMVYESWRERLAQQQALSDGDLLVARRLQFPRWATIDFESDIPAKKQVALQSLEFILEHEATWAQQVAKFKSPTLLIYGDQELGGIVGPDIAAEAKRINDLVTPVQIPGAGHSIRRERFDDFVAAVREFLAWIRHR
jgi:pimeloyl-ACP methyl ester carboxylesterase